MTQNGKIDAEWLLLTLNDARTPSTSLKRIPAKPKA